VATWCLGAPAGGIDPGGRVEAVSAGAGVVLDGITGPVEAAGEADLFLVTATTAEGLAQFVVPAAAAGVSVKEANSFDLVRRFAQVQFDQVVVGPDAVLGEQGAGPTDVEHQLQTVVVLQCAEMVGAMDRVFGFTVEYASDRYSFGRPLASYQALKHRFADMKVWLEASLATATAAARAVDSESKHAPELISVAKAYIGERGPAMLQDCVQLHGGIGVTWDHDLHLYLRRVVVDRTQWGTPRDHRERVAVAMGMDEGEGDR
jgi:alkylation response protein AidB-like acyl-CoA dehydrogenase